MVPVLERKSFEVIAGRHNAPVNARREIELDVTDENSLEKAVTKSKPNAVLNLAAYTDVDGSEAFRDLADRLNTEAAASLAKICSRVDAHLIHVSTDYVFDGADGNYAESDETNAINYYGKSKLEGEKRVEELARSYCIIRTSTPYGSHPSRQCFPKLVFDRLSAGESVRVVRDQITSPTFIANLGEMIAEAIEMRVHGILHLAGASAASRVSVARLVADSASLNGKLIVESSMDEMRWAAKRPRNSSLNVSRAKQMLSVKPVTIAEGIKSFASELLRLHEATPHRKRRLPV